MKQDVQQVTYEDLCDSHIVYVECLGIRWQDGHLHEETNEGQPWAEDIQSICLLVTASIHSANHLSFCLSIHPSINPSINQSIHVSVCQCQSYHMLETPSQQGNLRCHTETQKHGSLNITHLTLLFVSQSWDNRVVKVDTFGNFISLFLPIRPFLEYKPTPTRSHHTHRLSFPGHVSVAIIIILYKPICSRWSNHRLWWESSAHANTALIKNGDYSTFMPPGKMW